MATGLGCLAIYKKEGKIAGLPGKTVAAANCRENEITK
jgi:hypothetical protein